MEFLYLLEGIRNPWLTKLMLLITELGGETAFLVAALTVFWCLDKRRGYYLLTVGFAGTVCNQFLKLCFRVPRPWVLDPGFTPVEEAVSEAAGFSFPSGHSQSSVGTFGSLAVTARNRVIRWICIALVVLVPFSRMYLGVHTPKDVLVGAAISLALVFLIRPLVYRDKAMGWVVAGMITLAVGYLAFTCFYPFPADMDLYNLEHGREAGCTLLGCVLAVGVVYPVERRWVRFPNEAVWWAQILKILGGLALVLAVKSGLKAPLNALLPALPARAVRYFLVVVAAGLVWPMTFRWFSRLGRKKT